MAENLVGANPPVHERIAVEIVGRRVGPADNKDPELAWSCCAWRWRLRCRGRADRDAERVVRAPPLTEGPCWVRCSRPGFHPDMVRNSTVSARSAGADPTHPRLGRGGARRPLPKAHRLYRWI